VLGAPWEVVAADADLVFGAFNPAVAVLGHGVAVSCPDKAKGPEKNYLGGRSPNQAAAKGHFRLRPPK
jgi:hypothetical protein